MGISASELRENVYRILDEVLETGIAVAIDRGGRTSTCHSPAGERGVGAALVHRYAPKLVAHLYR